ncbi:outer membrane beta-barrel protein [Silvibacterium sp.]|uniref:outer membrane beta-barrel protein n=1 Tax=Silvibacterium sp. TaxID=1964179 RepID=UPI0039E37938
MNQWSRSVLCLLAVITLTVIAQAQTDVALSLYGAFNSKTSNGFNTQIPANAAGGMVELRHLSNPLLGYGVSYSYNRANQNYSIPLLCSRSPISCTIGQSVSANAHQIAFNWVPSIRLASLRPFGLLGVGVLFEQPAGDQTGTTSATMPVFDYGAGLDWSLLPHLGLRVQYRGNLYKAPDLSTILQSTGSFTQTAEPMIGAYFRL